MRPALKHSTEAKSQHLLCSSPFAAQIKLKLFKKIHKILKIKFTSISIWRSCISAASAKDADVAIAIAACPVTAKFCEIFQNVCSFSVNNPSKSVTNACRKYSGVLGVSKS
jgi:hypothetical protein